MRSSLGPIHANQGAPKSPFSNIATKLENVRFLNRT
jgi:hypothetical protein